MKRSPLSTPNGPNRRRHTPYNWNSHENMNKRGYSFTRDGDYQCLPANDRTQPTYGDDFIPLNMSTPVSQYKKNNRNWHSPRGRRNNNSSPDGGGRNYRNSYSTPRSNNSSNANARSNYRNNYYTPSTSSSNNSFSPYKQPFTSIRQYHQQRKGNKGAYRQVSISEYIDMPSCLEDPWEVLLKKLDNLRGTDNDKTHQIESSSNLESVDSNSTEKSESKVPRDVNLNDSRCSQESKMDSSVDTTFGEDTVNVSHTSKADSSLDLKIDGICFNQDSADESVSSSINDSVPPGPTGEKNDALPMNEPVADTDEKNI